MDGTTCRHCGEVIVTYWTTIPEDSEEDQRNGTYCEKLLYSLENRYCGTEPSFTDTELYRFLYSEGGIA